MDFLKRASLATLIASSLPMPALAELYFSQYIEGSSNNKALELINSSDSNIDLNGYRIELYSNGNSTVQSDLDLSGNLAAGESFVIVHASASASLQDQANLISSVTNFNGNDSLLLINSGSVVDRIGQLGNADYFGKDITLVRKFPIVADSTVDAAFDSTVNWDSYPKDTFEFLGSTDIPDTTTPPAQMLCGDSVTTISTLQGNGSASPLLGQMVAVEAIVVANFQADNQLKGFFIQEEARDQDNDNSTSEGLFIYDTSTSVQVGDRVLVQGKVDEFFGLTQLNTLKQVTVCASNNTLPSATWLQLPLTSADALETVEGMRVQLQDTLTVNEVYNLGRYGEFLVAKGRRFIPTEIAPPGTEAQKVNAANELNQLLIDDGISTQNPDPIIFPGTGLSAYNTLRSGDTLNSLEGIISYGFNQYRLIPTAAPVFNGDNARQLSPDFIDESQLRIASFNVLNYFNGDGLGGGFPTARGASNASELQRQQTKLVSALDSLNADIIGLMEIENDGFSEQSAIATLVNALNTVQPAGEEYAYIKVKRNSIGTDAIAVGLIYRPAHVTPINAAAILDSSNSARDSNNQPLFADNLNRPALAQSFSANGSDQRFTLVVNHLKSKGANNCDTVNDCDTNDGQGAYNVTRTRAAQALAIWLASNPTGVASPQQLVLGDLNSYSMEDPITTLAKAGYRSLKKTGDYSYVFQGASGNLDHALASPEFRENVIAVHDWHINTDEPRALDYNQEFKTQTQIDNLYAPSAFRSSDHDPVIIDLKVSKTPDNIDPIASFKTFKLWFFWVLISNSTDADGTLVSQQWQIGDLKIHSPIATIPRRYLKKHNIQQATLTVIDDKGQEASVTQSIRNSRIK